MSEKLRDKVARAMACSQGSSRKWDAMDRVTQAFWLREAEGAIAVVRSHDAETLTTLTTLTAAQAIEDGEPAVPAAFGSFS